MTVKEQLKLMGNERTSWMKVSGIDLGPGKPKKQEKATRRFFQLDADVYDAMMDPVSKAATRIVTKFLKEMNYATNVYAITYAELEEKLGLSKPTIENAMIELQTVDFIRKVRNGRWMVNPAVGIGCKTDFHDELFEKYFALRPYYPKTKRSVSQDVC